MQWNEKDNTITKTFEFSSYLDGIDFVNEVANLSEQENHHPDICLLYTSPSPRDRQKSRMPSSA